MPGRDSSSDEICDPPSSAGIEGAAPVLKVAPSYTAPPGASRILAAQRAVARGGERRRGRAARDRELGMRQQLTQHGAGVGVERHFELQVQHVLGAIEALPAERESLAVGLDRVEYMLDLQFEMPL